MKIQEKEIISYKEHTGTWFLTHSILLKKSR